MTKPKGDHVVDPWRRGSPLPEVRKGGTAGKTARTFQVRLPDGQVILKKKFNDLIGLPWAYCYEHNSRWFVAGISFQNDPRLASYRMIPCREVNVPRQAQEVVGFVETFRVSK